jgi:tetratricopeptide (TPR) repeat protein
MVHLLFVAVLLCLAPDLLPAKSESSRVPPEIRLDAERAIAARRVPEAVAAVEKGLKIDPSWTDGLWKIGLLLYQSDQFESALPYLARLTELEPSKGVGWALRGMCEFQTGNPLKAIEHIDRAERLGIPSQYRLGTAALLNRGLAHIQLGNFGTAAEFLAKLAPCEDPDEREQLVVALGYAALHLHLNASLTPEQQGLVRAVGEAHYLNDSRQDSAADAAFAELFRKYPKIPLVRYAYGTILLSRNDYKGAEREFHTELVNDSHSFLARLGLAYVALDNGDAQGGLSYAREAVSMQPNSYQPHLYYGRLLLQTAQAKEAATELEAARRIAPRDPGIRLVLAKAYRALGLIDQAAKELSEFERLKTSGHSARATQTTSSAPVIALP